MYVMIYTVQGRYIPDIEGTCSCCPEVVVQSARCSTCFLVDMMHYCCAYSDIVRHLMAVG